MCEFAWKFWLGKRSWPREKSKKIQLSSVQPHPKPAIINSMALLKYLLNPKIFDLGWNKGCGVETWIGGLTEMNFQAVDLKFLHMSPQPEPRWVDISHWVGFTPNLTRKPVYVKSIEFCTRRLQLKINMSYQHTIYLSLALRQCSLPLYKYWISKEQLGCSAGCVQRTFDSYLMAKVGTFSINW